MAQAGALEVIMFSNIARLVKDMSDAKSVVTRTVNTIEKTLGALGVGFSAHLLIAKIESVIDGMDKLQTASEITGASVESLSKLQFFAGVSGSSIEGVTGALAKLSKNMTETGKEASAASQALKFLGLSAKDSEGNLKGSDAMYAEIAKELFKYEDGAGKVAVAMALMGKAGAEQLPTMKKMIELGAIEASVTTEQGKAAEDYGVEVARLNQQKEILWNTVVSALLPSMQSFVGVLLDASKKTDSLGNAAKGLAADKSIENWADTAAMALAAVIDAFKVLPKVGAVAIAELVAAIAAADVARQAALVVNPGYIAGRAIAGGNAIQELKDAYKAMNLAQADADAKMKAFLISETDTTQRELGKQIAARKDFAKFIEGVGVDAMLDDAMFGGGESLKKLNFSLVDTKAAARLAAAELKLYEGAVKRLSDELGRLNQQSEGEKLAFELWGKEYQMADGSTVHLTGSLEKLSAEHKKLLPLLAAEIDKRKGLLEVSKLLGESYESMYRTLQQLQAIQTSVVQADQAYLDDLRFQIDLIGRARIEQEKMNEMRRIELKLKADLKAAADDAGDNMGQFDSARDALIAQAEAQKAIVTASVSSRIALERDWATGAKIAFNDYIDHATNAAEQSRMLFTNAFQSMEDALVKFAQTGKLDFKSLADSIIADLIRIQVRQSMASALGSAQGAGGFGGILGSIGSLFGFGGGGMSDAAAQDYIGSITPSFATGTDYVPRTGLAMVHQGERIIPASQNGGGAPNVQINVINPPGEPMSAKQSAPRFDAGQWVIDIVQSKLRSDAGVRDGFRSALGPPA